MEKREGYKKTAIGWIPEDWKLKKFKEVVSIVNGQVDPKEKPYCDMPHIGPANIDKRTGKLLSWHTAKEDLQTSGKYPFDEHHVLYGKINPHFGKVVFPNFKGICSADVYPLEPNLLSLTPSFLKYLLLESRFFNYTVSVSMRTGMPKINRNELAPFLFLLPPLPEQNKIASILTTVDDKISSIDSQIQQTEQLKKGLMEKLLTEGIGHTEFKETEIGRIPVGWDVNKIGNVISIKHGFAFKGEFFSNKDEGPILLTPGNFTRKGGLYFNGTNTKRYDSSFSNEYVLKKNELVIVMTDLSSKCEILGNPGIIKNDNEILLHNQRIGKVLFKNSIVNKDFIYQFFSSGQYKKEVRASATGTTVRHTSPKKIYDMTMPLPPLPEQKQIATILSTVDNKLDILNQKKSHYQTLKKGLSQQLLTGQMRVKV
jgi:type I restriction enzyme, S subunit